MSDLERHSLRDPCRLHHHQSVLQNQASNCKGLMPYLVLRKTRDYTLHRVLRRSKTLGFSPVHLQSRIRERRLAHRQSNTQGVLLVRLPSNNGKPQERDHIHLLSRLAKARTDHPQIQCQLMTSPNTPRLLDPEALSRRVLAPQLLPWT